MPKFFVPNGIILAFRPPRSILIGHLVHASDSCLPPLVSSILFAGTLIVGLGSLTTGCHKQTTATELPNPLKVGLLPDQDREKQSERYRLLFEYLSVALETPCEFVYTNDYNSLVKSFGDHKLDLAFFGGLTFVQAKLAFDAEPLIMRDIDTRFTSYFITRADNSGQTIEDFKGQRFAFGSNLSTSGHLMPRHFLNEGGIDPESYFNEVLYSGAHDKTIEWIQDGVAQIGAVNSQILLSIWEGGDEAERNIRIIGETPPYPDYVWTVHSTLSERNKNRIRDAFLLLSPDSEEHRLILKGMGANGFLPAEAENFADLEALAIRMGIIQNDN